MEANIRKRFEKQEALDLQVPTKITIYIWIYNGEGFSGNIRQGWFLYALKQTSQSDGLTFREKSLFEQSVKVERIQCLGCDWCWNNKTSRGW